MTVCEGKNGNNAYDLQPEVNFGNEKKKTNKANKISLNNTFTLKFLEETIKLFNN